MCLGICITSVRGTFLTVSQALRAACDRADRYARTGTADTRIRMSPPSAQRALRITATKGDVISPDEFSLALRDY